MSNGYFKKVYQSTIHGANQRLNNAWFIYSKLFFSISCFCFGVCDSVLHFVFVFWVSFCLIFWDIRHSGLVGDSILDLFVFPFGDSVFLFGIFVSQSRLTLGYHFPFWLCVFLCGVSGYVFESCFCFCYFRPPYLCTVRKTCHWTFVTRHAQPIISIPEITPFLLMFLVRRGHIMMYIFVRSRVLVP